MVLATYGTSPPLIRLLFQNSYFCLSSRRLGSFPIRGLRAKQRARLAMQRARRWGNWISHGFTNETESSSSRDDDDAAQISTPDQSCEFPRRSLKQNLARDRQIMHVRISAEAEIDMRCVSSRFQGKTGRSNRCTNVSTSVMFTLSLKSSKSLISRFTANVTKYVFVII